MTDPPIAAEEITATELTRIIREGTTAEQVAAGLVEIYED